MRGGGAGRRYTHFKFLFFFLIILFEFHLYDVILITDAFYLS